MVVVAMEVATVVGLVVEESSLGQWCGRRCHRAWGVWLFGAAWGGRCACLGRSCKPKKCGYIGLCEER